MLESRLHSRGHTRVAPKAPARRNGAQSTTSIWKFHLRYSYRFRLEDEVQTHKLPLDFLAARVRDAAPSPTLAVSDKARALKAQGIDVIDLGGGDPDFITPEHVRKAAADAMNAGDTHYVASNGTPALKKAIAAKLKTDNDLTYDPNEIIVTPGGKQS